MVDAIEPTTISIKRKSWSNQSMQYRTFTSTKKDSRREKFIKNLEKAMKLSEEFAEILSEKNVGFVNKAYLKIRSNQIFETLFLIDTDVFLSPEFKKMYTEAFNYVESKNTKTFQLDIRFTFSSPGSTNHDAIFADGFSYYYEKQSPRSRQA